MGRPDRQLQRRRLAVKRMETLAGGKVAAIGRKGETAAFREGLELAMGEQVPEVHLLRVVRPGKELAVSGKGQILRGLLAQLRLAEQARLRPGPVDQVSYDAWGNVISGSTSNLGLYGWDGYDYDAVANLYLNSARVYDPVSRQWTSQDPMGYAAGDSNLYRYVNNSPLDATDPSGMIVNGTIVNFNWTFCGGAQVSYLYLRDETGREAVIWVPAGTLGFHVDISISSFLGQGHVEDYLSGLSIGASGSLRAGPGAGVGFSQSSGVSGNLGGGVGIGGSVSIGEPIVIWKNF